MERFRRLNFKTLPEMDLLAQRVQAPSEPVPWSRVRNRSTVTGVSRTFSLARVVHPKRHPLQGRQRRRLERRDRIVPTAASRRSPATLSTADELDTRSCGHEFDEPPYGVRSTRQSVL